MGSKAHNRNLSLNHSKNPPNPTKFYQLSSFDIPHKMPIKKTQTKSAKNRVMGTVARADNGAGGAACQAAPANSSVSLRGFDPKTGVFTP